MSVKNIYRGLSGSKILITGATDGLGFGISIALAEEGADVIAVGRDKKKLEDLSDAAEQTKGTVTLVCIDLGSKEQSKTYQERYQKNLAHWKLLFTALCLHFKWCPLIRFP